MNRRTKKALERIAEQRTRAAALRTRHIDAAVDMLRADQALAEFAVAIERDGWTDDTRRQFDRLKLMVRDGDWRQYG